MLRRTLSVGVTLVWLAVVRGPTARGSSDAGLHQEAGTGVHVARIPRDGPFVTRVVLAHDRVGGAMEPVSAMCRRIGAACLVAVNGDFGDVRSQQAIGGVVIDDRMVRSPHGNHFQVSRSRRGGLHAGYLFWSAKLSLSDGSAWSIDAVNRERGADQVVLYSPEFHRSTRTDGTGFELMLETRGDVLAVGRTTAVRVLGPSGRPGSSELVRGRAVLSGHGAGAQRLRDLWQRVQSGPAGAGAQLIVDIATPRMDGGLDWSVGCAPIVLRDGQPVKLDPADPMVVNFHPRTIIGWNPAGDMVWVTVDGRAPGYSMGLRLQSPRGVPEAARFMRERFGVSDACNLDGGGSTTFAVLGRVMNRPCCDRTERPVAMALVAQPRPGAAPAAPAVTPPPPPPPTTVAPPVVAPPPPPVQEAPPPQVPVPSAAPPSSPPSVSGPTTVTAPPQPSLASGQRQGTAGREGAGPAPARAGAVAAAWSLLFLSACAVGAVHAGRGRTRASLMSRPGPGP